MVKEVDGVIGFSQGALMAGMLCAHLELTGGSRLPRFAILCKIPLAAPVQSTSQMVA